MNLVNPIAEGTIVAAADACLCAESERTQSGCVSLRVDRTVGKTVGLRVAV